MIIKILGSGCPNCKRLENNAKLAVKDLGIDAEIIKVTSFTEIAKYGVMSTPGLVVDEVVKSYGKVISPEEIKQLLT